MKAFILGNWRYASIVFGAMALYVILCIVIIGQASLWFDEAYSALIIRKDVVALIHTTALDVHPPLYYLVLKVWAFLFGSGEVALRSLSVVFGAAVVMISYGIARQVGIRRYAWVVPYFLALSPALIHYGVTARMYTMLTFLVVLSVSLLLAAQRATDKKGLWSVHGAVIGMGLLTHYFMVLYWVAQWCMVSMMTWRRGERRWQTILMPNGWKRSVAVALIVSCVWLPFYVTTGISRQVQGFWIPPVTLETIGNTITRTLMYEPIIHLPWWQLGLVVILVITIVLLIKYEGISGNFRKIYFVAAVPWLLLILASLPPFVSKYYDRYLVPSMVFGALIVGLYATFIFSKKGRTRLLAWIVAGLYVIVSCIGVLNVYMRGNYNEFDGVTSVGEIIRDIEARGDRGVMIDIPHPGLSAVAKYYSSAGAVSATWLGSSYELHNTRVVERIQRKVKAGSSIWVIDYREEVSADANSVLPIPIWNFIPDNWQILDEIQYDDSREWRSQRAVKYKVGHEQEDF